MLIIDTMEYIDSSAVNTLEIGCVILGAILAYGFGRYQHHREYKEELKHKIFGSLLSVDLPNAYVEFMDHPKSSEKYNVYSNRLKELVKKCSVLQIRNKKQYIKIKKLVLDIDELSGFTTYHIVDNVKTPIEITEINAIENRKKEIDSLFKKLYRIIGVDNYRNVIYVGPIKYFSQLIYDMIFNRYKSN